jgi:geranyl-CoA carboxylase alpha subunit
MVKAAAGGGGKGMRLVSEPAALAEALRAARSEAQKAFGSDELILEKAIAAPRHVEIQVFADGHGHVIHLGERDCSIQRRHQKVIEEAPSPALTPELRWAMGEAAVTAARSIAYVGAGTVEFLLAPDGAFYFLEMNTRLQVEHAVTELVTGLDLIEWQIRIAAGETLPLRQEEVSFTGHAIEARLYAEDTAGDFLPQAGRVLAWVPPRRDGVRVDHGIAADVAISPYYDPMLAKLIAHGATREEARRRLVSALLDTVVLGIVTNRRFLIDCLSHAAFATGEVDTGFIARHFPPAVRAGAAPDPRMLALAAALIVERGRGSSGGAPSHWRSSGPAAVPLRLRCGDTQTAFEVTGEGERRFRVAWGGESCAVTLLSQDGACLRFLADGLAETAHVAWEGDALHLSLGGDTAVFADVLLAARVAAEGAAGGAALAPMTGTIAAVRVKPGDAVRRGQCLLVLEAMKMEHEVTSPRDGTVAAVLVSLGEPVAMRKLLVELAPKRDQDSG